MFLKLGAPGRITGYDVVVSEFVSAVSKHGRPGALRMFTETARTQSTRRESRARKSVSLQSFETCIAELDDLELTAWHDVEPNIAKPLTLRSCIARRPFPVTYSTHNAHPQDGLRKIVQPLLLGETLPFDSVVCASESLRRSLASMIDFTAASLGRRFRARFKYRGRLDRIPWGVDTDRFRPRSRARARDRFELPRDAFVIMWLGRITPSLKGDLVPFLHVLQQLIVAHPDRKILFVLAGPVHEHHYDEALERRAEQLGIGGCLRFLGPLEPDRRHEIYAIADVFFSLSDWLAEGFGLTPVEAMASGVPQVVSDWDGYRDTVVDGETGFRVPTLWGDIDADLLTAVLSDRSDRDFRIAQSVVMDLPACHRALQSLLISRPLRRRMAAASRARAVSEYSWETVVSRYEALWADLASTSVRRWTPRRHRTPYDPRIFATHGNMASRALQSDDRIRCSARAEGRGGASLPLLEGATGIEPPLLDAILERCPPAGRRARVVGRLVRELAKERSRSVALVPRHVLWLLKYGYVELDSALELEPG